MAKETVYNNTLVSGAADETLTYTRYVKDESSGKSTKELLDEKVNKTDKLGTTQLENESVTSEKLAENSVDGRKVCDGSIENRHIGNNAVSTSKIASRSVTNEKIAHDSVSRAELTPDVRISIDKKADAEQVNNSIYNLENKIGERFVVEGDVTNLPDEEDLTSVKESERDVLKLADRSYAPEKFSGKGYKILRRNIKPVSIAVTKIRVESVPSSDGTLSFTINGKETQVAVYASTDNTTALVAQKVASAFQASMTEYEVSADTSLITLTRKSAGSVTPSVFSTGTTGVVCTVTDSTKREFRNILTADMLNEANTIYEIRYDFDLNGETVEIPEGCTLKFCGGILKYGTINCSSTIINSKPIHVFYNVILQGSIIGDVIINWFKHSSDCVESMYNLSCAIKIVGKYTIDKPLVVRTGFNIYGESMYKSRLFLDKEYNESVRTIFHLIDSKESINYISFRDFSVASEDYVFYRNCADISSGSSLQVGDFKNLYFDSIKKAIFSIKCFGFGCINFNNLYVIGDSECSQPLFNFTNHWWNNNNIEKCRVNAKCKGLLSVVCSNTGEINRNSINNNWVELTTLHNSNDLIRMESDGVIYQLNFNENYIERNYTNDGDNINIFHLSQPDGDRLIRQININNNSIISKYKSLLTCDITINGICISNNTFSDTPIINSTKGKSILDAFEYNNNKKIEYHCGTITNNILDNFSSVEAKTNKLSDNIDKFGFGYANEIIKGRESKKISLIPNSFTRKIWYSDVCIYNTTGTIVVVGKIIEKYNNTRKFVTIHNESSDITVNDDSGNIVITNNTSDNLEVICSTILRTL